MKPVLLFLSLCLLSACAHIRKAAPATPLAAVVERHVPPQEDVYTALATLGKLQDDGSIDGFRYVDTGEEAFYVWRMDPAGEGGTLVRMEMDGYKFGGSESATVPHLPPHFPDGAIDPTLKFH